MDGLILFVIFLIVFVIVMPLAAIGKASGASSEVRALRRRLDELERRLRELGGEATPVSGSKAETSVVKEGTKRSSEQEQAKEKPTESKAEPRPAAEWDEAREVPPAASLAATPTKPLRAVAIPAPEAEQEVAREPSAEPADVEPVAAKSAAVEPPKVESDAGSLEMKLGTYWFVRIGVVLLLTGAGILAYYKKQFFFDLSPLTKVCGLYVLSALMGGVGFWLQHAKEKYKNYGQVLVAGGFSGIYFTTYAAHILEPVKVIPDPTVALLLLLAWGGFMVWVADRLKSETMALFAIGASYYATYVPLIHSGGVSHSVILASNLILAVAAVVFMLRNRWLKMPVVSMGAAYTGFLVWRLRVLEDPSLSLVLLFACSLWVVYTAAVFLSRHEDFDDKKRSTFLTANNAAMFGLLTWDVLRHNQSQFWILPMAFGAVLLGCALASVRLLKDQPLSRNSYLTQGLVLVSLGLMATQLSDSVKGPIFAAESVVLLCMAIRLKNNIFQIAAFIAAMIAAFFGFIDIGSGSGNYFVGCMSIGAFLLFDAWLCHRRIEAGNTSPLRPRVTYFAGFGLAIGLAAFNARWLGDTSVHEWMPAILLATTALFCASAYLLKVREFVLLGQAPAVLGIILSLGVASATPAFSWSLAFALVGALGLGHWWRWGREKFNACCPDREQVKAVPVIAEAAFSAAAVSLLLVWIHAGIGFGVAWLLAGSLLAAGLVAYGAVTRAPFVACFGQVFLAVACGVLVRDCFHGGGENALSALVPIATLWLTNLVLPSASPRIGEVLDLCQLGFRRLQTTYRFTAGGLGLLWIYRFVPDDYQVLVTGLLSGLFLLAYRWRPAKEWHSLSAAYALVSSLYLMAEFARGHALWQSLVAIVALLAVQQLARRRVRQLEIPDPAHQALILGGGIALFFWATNHVSTWMPEVEGHGLRSIIWAVLAVIYFTLGLKLKERWYRLMGLGTLGVALLSLVPIIWQMSTELKIASFFVLGLVFVGLGFVYNRNKEQIKKLL
jgi:hypothetical protein